MLCVEWLGNVSAASSSYNQDITTQVFPCEGATGKDASVHEVVAVLLSSVEDVWVLVDYLAQSPPTIK